MTIRPTVKIRLSLKSCRRFAPEWDLLPEPSAYPHPSPQKGNRLAPANRILSHIIGPDTRAAMRSRSPT